MKSSPEDKKRQENIMRDMEIFLHDGSMSVDLFRDIAMGLMLKCGLMDKFTKFTSDYKRNDNTYFKNEDFAFGILLSFGIFANTEQALPTYLPEQLSSGISNMLGSLGMAWFGEEKELSVFIKQMKKNMGK